MKVTILSSISPGCAAFAKATISAKLRYCLRHGYSLSLGNRPYETSVLEGLLDILCALDEFDVVWILDSDALITGTQPIHEVPGLGPHVSVCRETIDPRNPINCGSMVFAATDRTRRLVREIYDAENEWRQMPCLWQSWLCDRLPQLQADRTLTLLPPRAFNSTVWNHSGGGCHWEPGDLVYHPCGIVPHELRAEALRELAATLEATP